MKKATFTGASAKVDAKFDYIISPLLPPTTKESVRRAYQDMAGLAAARRSQSRTPVTR